MNRRKSNRICALFEMNFYRTRSVIVIQGRIQSRPIQTFYAGKSACKRLIYAADGKLEIFILGQVHRRHLKTFARSPIGNSGLILYSRSRIKRKHYIASLIDGYRPLDFSTYAGKVSERRNRIADCFAARVFVRRFDFNACGRIYGRLSPTGRYFSYTVGYNAGFGFENVISSPPATGFVCSESHFQTLPSFVQISGFMSSGFVIAELSTSFLISSLNAVIHTQ